MKTLITALAVLIGTLSVSAQRGYYGRSYNHGSYNGYSRSYGYNNYRPYEHNYYRPYERNYYRPQVYIAPRPLYYRPFVPRPIFFPPVIGVHINAYPPVRHVYSETYVERQPAAMSDYDFNNARNTIYNRNTDESKMVVARQVADNNYLTSSQVREMLGLFSFEDSKLQFAEYAYSKVVDPNNYYVVNDAFSYESSITELDNYIKGRR